MRVVLIILFLISGIQAVEAQACGVYRLEYKATLTSDSLELKSIQLPSTAYLHGIIDLASSGSMEEFTIESKSFNEVVISHLSCHVTASSQGLFNLYQESVTGFTLVIKGLNEQRKERYLIHSIAWSDITLEPSTDKVKMVLHLGELKL